MSIFFHSFPSDILSEAKPRGAEARDIIASTAIRLYSDVVPVARELFGNRIAHIPWTSEETKAARKRKFRADRQVIMDLLRREGSGACAIYRGLGLSREVTKCMSRLSQDQRRKQVVFSSIACAARFEMFDQQGELQEAK